MIRIAGVPPGVKQQPTTAPDQGCDIVCVAPAPLKLYAFE